MPNGCNFIKRESPEQTSCCDTHDRAYVHRTTSKFQADLNLSKCLWNEGHKILAVVSFIGTSTFGWIWWLKYRLD